MPVNPGIEYQLAEKKYLEAKTIPEKLRALEEMLSTVPKHKGSEGLQQQIKNKISKLKKIIEKEKKQRKKGHSFSIKKEGAAQVVIVGKTNSGKSYLLSKLTNAKPQISEYEFTTKTPEVGVMDYNGVKIQIIEIPAVTSSFIKREKGPMFLSIVRNSDLVILIVRDLDELKFLINELDRANIKISDSVVSRESVIAYLKGIVVSNSMNKIKFLNIDSIKIDNEKLDKFIWDHLGLIYVYTKSPGKEKDWPPVCLKKGSKVKDLAGMIHKDFLSKFKYARVWGSSVKHDGILTGLDHTLNSEDIVEFHLK